RRQARGSGPVSGTGERGRAGGRGRSDRRRQPRAVRASRRARLDRHARARLAVLRGVLRGPDARRRVPCARHDASGVGAGMSDVRVLIADDQQLLRASFAVLVGNAGGLEVVGEAGDGREAVEQVRALRPDVVLMDIRMPEMDGIEATEQICGSPDTADVKVIILTTFDLDAYVFSALRAGASGFLLKDTPPGDLLAAIRVVADGEALLAPTITRRLIAEFAKRPEQRWRPTRRLDGITAREREVLTLVGQGLSNQEIAEQLVVSMATVKTHIGQLLAKLHARDRAQLVIAAYEHGLVYVG